MPESYQQLQKPNLSPSIAKELKAEGLNIGGGYCRRVVHNDLRVRIKCFDSDSALPEHVRILDNDRCIDVTVEDVRDLVRAHHNIGTALNEGRYSRALSLADDNQGEDGLPQRFLKKAAKTAFEGSLEAGSKSAKGRHMDYEAARKAAWKELKVAQYCLTRPYHPSGIAGRKSDAVELVKALREADLYAKMVGVLNMTVADPDKPSKEVLLFSEEERESYIGKATARLKRWIKKHIKTIDINDLEIVGGLAKELGRGKFATDLASLINTYATAAETIRVTKDSDDKLTRKAREEEKQRKRVLADMRKNL